MIYPLPSLVFENFADSFLSSCKVPPLQLHAPWTCITSLAWSSLTHLHPRDIASQTLCSSRSSFCGFLLRLGLTFHVRFHVHIVLRHRCSIFPSPLRLSSDVAYSRCIFCTLSIHVHTRPTPRRFVPKFPIIATFSAVCACSCGRLLDEL